MNICIIPARGNSKRIPKKNIRLFHEKPMITWSIENAIRSKVFDKVIVSTDNQEIAEIAKSSGAEVPFIRPRYLSEDNIATYTVIDHAIKYFLKKDTDLKFICCLYATAPFTTKEDLMKAFQLIKEEYQGTYVFAASKFPFPIQRAIKIDKKGYSSVKDKANIKKRSQDLEEYYHDVGQFYFASKNTWLNHEDIFEKGKPLIIPRWRVEDIDTEEDWLRAEKLFKMLQE